MRHHRVTSMLSIAIPKGSLEEQTFLLFKQADLEIKRTEREYNPKINDPRIGKVKILRPQEIAGYVAEGYFDVGITGHDWVIESGADVIEIADMPYSKQGAGIVKIVIAVPDDQKIKDASDIKPHSRVTTEYPNITRSYFERLGIPVTIHFSYGATEAKVPDLMDVVVDVTETGSTLRKNNLKIIDVMLESTTKLVVNKDSWNDSTKRRAIEEIRTLLLAVIEARGKVLLDMNVPAGKLDELIAALPAMKLPTVTKLYNSEYYAVETVVAKETVNILIPELKRLGAEDILELGISKIVR